MKETDGVQPVTRKNVSENRHRLLTCQHAVGQTVARPTNHNGVLKMTKRRKTNRRSGRRGPTANSSDGRARKFEKKLGARPSENHHPMEEMLTEKEEDKLILAAGMAIHPVPFGKEQIIPVIAWGRHVRLGECLVGLTLSGHLLPVGVKSDGDIGFAPVDGVLSSGAARSYRKELKELSSGLPAVDKGGTKQAPSVHSPLKIPPPMRASLRLAVAAGKRGGNANPVELETMLDFTREVLEGSCQLRVVLAGHLLPVADPDGGSVRFRCTSDLAPADQDGYRANLKVIEGHNVASNPAPWIPWELN